MSPDFSRNFQKIKAFAEQYISDGGFISDFLNPDKYIILPGLCDVHVHFREPGFSYKETIETGSAAAAHSGYTSVCTMPNLDPVPDCPANLDIQLKLIKSNPISIYPYGSITIGERGEKLSEFDKIYKEVCAFSDDGKGVQSEEIMRAAMKKAKSLNKLIVAHCEVNSLLCGGYINDGSYAKLHGHKGISAESEYLEIERDLRIAKETGCAFHVCHISCAKSVELIRKAKSEGVNVTCETAPHYLTLCEDDIQESGRFKMNPPLRSKKDRDALIEGICDGTIDIIATDHAPHSEEEKARGLEKSLMGVVGLETAFPVLYTELVKKKVISLEKLIALMSFSPKARFGIESKDDFTVFEIANEYKINPSDFFSKGHSTPFENKSVFGKCVLTVAGGNVIWQDNSTEK